MLNRCPNSIFHCVTSIDLDPKPLILNNIWTSSWNNSDSIDLSSTFRWEYNLLYWWNTYLCLNYFAFEFTFTQWKRTITVLRASLTVSDHYFLIAKLLTNGLLQGYLGCAMANIKGKNHGYKRSPSMWTDPQN